MGLTTLLAPPSLRLTLFSQASVIFFFGFLSSFVSDLRPHSTCTQFAGLHGDAMAWAVLLQLSWRSLDGSGGCCDCRFGCFQLLGLIKGLLWISVISSPGPLSLRRMNRLLPCVLRIGIIQKGSRWTNYSMVAAKCWGEGTPRKLETPTQPQFSRTVISLSWAHVTEWSRAYWGNGKAVSLICAAPFSNMCSTHADNSSLKLRLRWCFQFPWCALTLTETGRSAGYSPWATRNVKYPFLQDGR
jgi:hypothetical protein